jgi:osmoprotectant transport system permease protein
MRAIGDGFTYIVKNPDLVWPLFVAHVQITLLALGLALASALPLGIAIARYRWLGGPVLGVLDALYTIPSLALIILLIPFFGLGATSVVVALVLYAQVILVRNIVAGLGAIDPAMVEAARGLGMNGWQTWWRVQFPLALPVILAGVRIAAIVCIGIAAIGAEFGVDNLGRLLFDGVAQVGRADKIWAGTILTGALALVVNSSLLAFERLLAPPARAHPARPGARAAGTAPPAQS